MAVVIKMIFLNGISPQISGHKKRILVVRKEKMLLVFLSAPKDILVRDTMALFIRISGSTTPETIHGLKKPTLEEQQDGTRLGFPSVQKDISVRERTSL